LERQRKCPTCKELHPLSNFVRNPTSGDGYGVCKPCRRVRDAANREANRERFRAEHAAWRAANREHVRAYARRKAAELRDAVLAAYGGECACCGEQQQEFLTLDHIEGGGTAHRKATHRKVYEQLRRDGFPPGYRIFCWNCNWAYRLSGSCPHQQTERRDLHLA
jgi:hypothetical protein